MDDRRPRRQDTFDLRDQMVSDDHVIVQNHADATLHYNSTDDEEHSVLEDDSDGEDRDMDYIDEDDDGSSSLSIPNESIDFDLVYSLHSFAATVEGQANVVKGDSLFLMDDSNSYWWLVRVLKTQEVGYIPAENIETPFERLARLNKHRNVDLASATQAELQEGAHASRDALRNNLSSRQGQRQTPSPLPGSSDSVARQQQPSRGVAFTPALSVHRYPPAVWNEEEEEDEDVEWDDEGYEDEDPDLADEQMQQRRDAEGGPMSMEPDDGMGWDDSVAEDMQQATAIPAALKPGLNAEQHQQMMQVQQKHQLALVQQQQLSLRQPGSRERVDSTASNTASTSPKRLDPAEATLETRKLSVTPSIARDGMEPQPISALLPSGPLLPSAIMQQQDEDRKRTREEIEALEESSRKKIQKITKNGSVSSTNSVRSTTTVSGSLKRKDLEDEVAREREKEKEREKDKEKDKKNKSGGLFGGLFGRKKDKGKEREKGASSVGSVGSVTSLGSIEGELVRGSEDSSRPSNGGSRPSLTSPESVISPTTAQASIQQEQLQANLRNPADPKRIIQTQQVTSQQQSELHPHVSQHASQLRQRDQHQQALYQKYLNSSPSSQPEAQPSYGLQSASAVMPPSNSTAPGTGLGPHTPKVRPGSLILSPTTGESHVPELSVIRVFAGKNVQTEATFKTVLLNTSTTTDDLVRQAIQRFRLPAGENVNDYFLTVKQLEGSTAVLLPSENPLGVFETLVEAAMEVPKVKRSSVGSISSLASNLSMHPAIKKLSMNDFTDDSAVKLYLNRKGGDDDYDSGGAEDGDLTLMAETSHGEDAEAHEKRLLSVSTNPNNNNVTPERFSSPSFRFALQLVIYPEDLPDDMVFDPMTEAIVFKETLRDRSPRGSVISPGVSQTMRRKVFVFPKNVTVAEVIELGLERFGILEGVVDGGDEVEDKLTKRRSSARVRYGLNVDVVGSPERELSPSSRIIEAFPRPPSYRAVDRRLSDGKRRSIDSAQLLGSPDDINPDDPIFVLRRAVSYRHSSRHRHAPLDEIALQHLHRESGASGSSASDVLSTDESKQKPSRQDIIAAQRAATRANQRAILSAQTNSVRGVDVLLPGNAMIRSSRFETDDRMRYSYVEPDGEAFDISDIVEEEWQGNNGADRNDLLEGVLARNKDGLGDKLDRVLNKIKDGKANSRPPVSAMSGRESQDSMPSASGSEYSDDAQPQETSRSATPVSPNSNNRTPTPTSPGYNGSQRGASPSSILRNAATQARAQPERQPSIQSVMSEVSRYATPTGESTSGSRRPTPPAEVPPVSRYATPSSESHYGSSSRNAASATSLSQRKRPVLPKDDFGASHMMAIIELGAMRPKIPVAPLDIVDELLFGRPIDLASLHPQIREIYSGAFKQLEDIDKVLDDFLKHTISGL